MKLVALLIILFIVRNGKCGSSYITTGKPTAKEETTTPEPLLDTTCTGDLKFNICGTDCEATCGQAKPTECTDECVPGCQCRDGQWKDGDKCFDNNEDCPKNITDPKSTDCEGDLVFNICGTACEKICGQTAPEICTQQCVAECQCPWGQWREGTKCYNTTEECPHNETPLFCEGDLELTDCKTCEKVCGLPLPDQCTDPCVAGCQCPEGTWRKGTNCYETIEECENTDKEPLECEGDLVFNICGTACENICGEPAPTACTRQCVTECQCPEKQWRLGDKCYNSTNDCPTAVTPAKIHCGNGLVHVENGSCENICGPVGPATPCTTTGCRCPDNKWRNGTKCYADATCSSGANNVSFVILAIVAARFVSNVFF